MTIAASIDQLLVYLKIKKNSSPLTIRNYRHYLNRFYAFCANQRPPLLYPEKISEPILRKYTNYLNDFVDAKGDPLMRKTKAYHLIAIRTLLRFLDSRGIKTVSPSVVILPKMEMQKEKKIDKRIIERMVNRIPIGIPQTLRDRTILTLITTSNLSVSEVVGLNRNALHLGDNTIEVIGRKRRRRIVPITHEAAALLRKYLLTRTDLYPPVFVRYSGKKDDPRNVAEGCRLNVRSIQRMVKKYAGDKRLAIHLTPEVLKSLRIQSSSNL